MEGIIQRSVRRYNLQRCLHNIIERNDIIIALQYTLDVSLLEMEFPCFSCVCIIQAEVNQVKLETQVGESYVVL